jgi:hypothetical protein
MLVISFMLLLVINGLQACSAACPRGPPGSASVARGMAAAYSS